MVELQLTKQDVIKEFENNTTIMICSGLWNNPLTNSRKASSKEEIERFYNWASKVDVKQYEDVIYLHGYSSCDMF